MSATLTATVADRAADAFVAGDRDALLALCADDVLFDANVPEWRYQLAGRRALGDALDEGEFVPGRRITVQRRTQTADGLLLQTETRAPVDGEERLWRQVTHLRVADGAVAEMVLYCTGVWDAATIARQAVEAPMVRP